MGRRSFIRRVVLPAAYVLGVMIVSSNIYDLSRSVDGRLLHGLLSRRKIKDKSIKVFALSNSALLVISLTAVCLMLWNGGHSYYYLYMDLYARLFL